MSEGSALNGIGGSVSSVALFVFEHQNVPWLNL